MAKRVVRTMKKISLIACLLGSVSAMTACGPLSRDFSDSHPQMVAAPDTVSGMLADAADRSSRALEKLAAIEHARAPAVGVAPSGDAPAHLRRAVTVNWVGPVEPVTKAMAERAGYTFMPIGTPPPTPVIVSIDAENRPVIDVLRDIGLQIGMRGDIKVDSTRKTVELQYPANTGVAQ